VLHVLTGIASGLNVTLSRLMAEGTSSSVASVIRRQQRMIFRDQETGIERHLLSPTHLDTGIELSLVRGTEIAQWQITALDQAMRVIGCLTRK
jgi:hypothetical protein